METLTRNTLHKTTRQDLLSRLADAFRDTYVYPETGLLLHDTLQMWREEETPEDQDTAAWCKGLTRRLRALVPDLHLNVFPRTVEETRGQAVHQGVQKFEYLAGNVAYVDLRGFFEPESAVPMLDAVMTLARPAKGLIIDLRKNGGGSGETVAYLCSHLLAARTHLQSFTERGSDFKRQSWTLPYLPHRDTEKPVVVLISKHTGSAAEEFAYNLKALKRATLIGETTAGAAHTVNIISLNDEVGAFIPTGHPISPYTEGHWEGVGVTPDIEVKSEEALEKALEHLQSLP
ncbi:S41 family peptidase [Deinococcus cellulosilyticus]|uniref:Interphotoreceptor retinoid-binding protein n=1 Tax=Deinococcus cellulosilyticus (strain DSM 18568 / NBRC 106333 / KACC 11606 / 5516J-15) TaxID=1223518 RepID=A0A511N9S2_DEIC1|nr:S41 family peptidase [Deinococcus cellulosilyticus]GEM49575.1 interphotoreceptor retinoid-binding protein [Deinococcus cellulosilyticus NBRC 106333 = KACC 11606]